MIFFLTVSFIYSQTSLFSGVNPYNNRLKTGDIIKVRVNNNFSINLSGDYNRNFEVKLKLMPDNNNLPFLKQSEESRTNVRKIKEKQVAIEKFIFDLPARIVVQDDGIITINGNSTINTNGKMTQTTLTGIINEGSVKNRTVISSEILNLNMQINSRPELPRDRTFSPNEPPESSDSSGFSEEEIKRYVNQYLQEILGGLQ